MADDDPLPFADFKALLTPYGVGARWPDDEVAARVLAHKPHAWLYLTSGGTDGHQVVWAKEMTRTTAAEVLEYFSRLVNNGPAAEDWQPRRGGGHFKYFVTRHL